MYILEKIELHRSNGTTHDESLKNLQKNEKKKNKIPNFNDVCKKKQFKKETRSCYTLLFFTFHALRQHYLTF